MTRYAISDGDKKCAFAFFQSRAHMSVVNTTRPECSATKKILKRFQNVFSSCGRHHPDPPLMQTRAALPIRQHDQLDADDQEVSAGDGGTGTDRRGAHAVSIHVRDSGDADSHVHGSAAPVPGRHPVHMDGSGAVRLRHVGGDGGVRAAEQRPDAEGRHRALPLPDIRDRTVHGSRGEVAPDQEAADSGVPLQDLGEAGLQSSAATPKSSSTSYKRNPQPMARSTTSLPASCSAHWDVVCETAMGEQIGAQSDPDAQYVRTIHSMGDAFVER